MEHTIPEIVVVDEDETEDENDSCFSDDYEASIELANNCRQFYLERVKSTEAFKHAAREAWKSRHKTAGSRTSSIDQAMDKLRSEVAELMDQDLSLMEQLLTLNDKIEEVKSRHNYGSGSSSYLWSSSCDLAASELSCNLAGSELSLMESESCNKDEDQSTCNKELSGVSGR